MNLHTEIVLGPLTQAICTKASWEGQDDFPSNQVWADEVERTLSFLQVKNQLERYRSNLKGKLTQRDGALAEARVALFLHRNNFSILSWEPKGASLKIGEFEIQWQNEEPIFVEVKGPRWEGELNGDEKSGSRKKQPRYINAEYRRIDPVERVLCVAEKALPKFMSNKPNLLVVVDDLLFVSPTQLPKNVLIPQIEFGFKERNLTEIGGILIFHTNCKENHVEYSVVFIENPTVNPTCRLAKSVVVYLKSA